MEERENYQEMFAVRHWPSSKKLKTGSDCVSWFGEARKEVYLPFIESGLLWSYNLSSDLS